MPHVLHTIWLDSHEPTNKDTLWIKPMKEEGHYGAYVFGPAGWVLLSAISESIIEDLQSDWAENNPISPFYIKNRTHWVEIQPGPDGGEVVHKLDNKFLNLTTTEPTEGDYNPITSDAVTKAIQDALNQAIGDLENYYTKSETYSKTEINDLLGKIEQFHFEVYPTLPAIGKENVLYFIGPNESGGYEEYIYNGNTFIKIGETSSPGNYVTIEQLQQALSTKQDVLIFDDLPTSGSSNPVKSGGVYIALEAKQDKAYYITDIPSTGMLPNHFYEYGNISSPSYTFAMNTTDVDSSLANIWIWGFNPLSNTEIIWPAAITQWKNNVVPEIVAGNRYEISVVCGLATCVTTARETVPSESSSSEESGTTEG